MVPASSAGAASSISACRRVVLSTARQRERTACGISLIPALTLRFMLTTQRLFIDTDHTLREEKNQELVCERTCQEIKTQPGGEVQTQISGVSVWDDVCLGDLMIYCTFSHPAQKKKTTFQLPSSKVLLRKQQRPRKYRERGFFFSFNQTPQRSISPKFPARSFFKRVKSAAVLFEHFALEGILQLSV